MVGRKSSPPLFPLWSVIRGIAAPDMRRAPPGEEVGGGNDMLKKKNKANLGGERL